MINLQTFLELSGNQPNIRASSTLLSDRDIIRLFRANEIDKMKMLYCGIKEYDNIDFTGVQISLENWDTEKLIRVHFPRWSQEYWENKIATATADTIKEWDLSLPQEVRCDRIDYWIKFGTWKTPIVIFNSASFEDGALQLPFQLFEGHHRLERLKVIYKYNSIKLAKNHLVFVISKF